MYTRQAAVRLLALALLIAASACSTPPATAVITAAPSTPTPAPSLTPTPAPTATATPLACLTQPGHLEDAILETTKPAQEFKIYLPPCYGEQPDLRYPVLYLLHGQTYTDDQWVRLGAVRIADQLILSGEAPPFLMVFPDDRYWNLPPGAGFGDRLLDDLVPYVDATYRTLPDRAHRALGGLSRGGGWTFRLGITHSDLFGALGLHSPAIFKDDVSNLVSWIGAVPPESFPRLWIDIGDRDQELGVAGLLENVLSRYEIVHDFHLYAGDHTEHYWSQHVQEYLEWYVAGWQPAASETPEP